MLFLLKRFAGNRPASVMASQFYLAAVSGYSDKYANDKAQGMYHNDGLSCTYSGNWEHNVQFVLVHHQRINKLLRINSHQLKPITSQMQTSHCQSCSTLKNIKILFWSVLSGYYDDI